ncbi:SIR2 family NAD-dependent protein deacylase [Alkalitalea saponilacus]|uniref:protein acetyllysine N-acetyltransferase n=1 Tax=Alkalitalea saponilacus TaxID=889453 RepID=A0A1T5D6K5_9BACT|nr:NAD-dependent deacylase [Alkalitalea saponilacus]ASB50594.1 RNA polymerase subunit sigma [Alkalitalea saponilacus]SKB67130.1 NAD-dependent deacetylase [Alkalitalea saponilacus]
MQIDLLKNAAEIIKESKYCIAFTGAGISVESGIPPFRGENSIWSKYDPINLDLSYFIEHPDKTWPIIKEIFYDFIGNAKPNKGHDALAWLEKAGMLKCIITQNIDNLHQEAGSETVWEFHGNSQRLVCMNCNNHFPSVDADFSQLPPTCDKCNGLIKPDFIFFGERIPQIAYDKSMEASQNADVCIIVGSTGEVMPAASVPVVAKRNGAVIIEVNPEESLFTRDVTDFHLQGKAGLILEELVGVIKE